MHKRYQQLHPLSGQYLKQLQHQLVTKYKRKKSDSSSTSVSTCVVAAAVLLKERNIHMSAIQHLLSLLLWHGNSSTFNILGEYAYTAL